MPQYSEVYLDNNATTPPHQKVVEAMTEVLLSAPLNASSIHASGRYARSLVENAREKIARLVNAGDSRIVFTATGTEANNMALRGLERYKVLVSSIEHASVLKLGVHANIIPADENGIVDIAGLERLLKQFSGEKVLVSVMLANNETGAVQPLKEIAQAVHYHGGMVHTDAVQAVGKIKVDMQELGVDMLTISAHKFGGPQGAAALVFTKHVPMSALIAGGGQEQGFRAGTLNVPAIHGFGVAVDEAENYISDMQQISVLREGIEQSIKNIAPEAVIFCQNTNRLPNTIMVAMPFVTSETQIIHFDMEGIAISSGAACSSGKVETSHVLLAMGVNPELAKCAIRVSLGNNNTMQDAEHFISSWKRLYERTSSKKAA